MGVQRGHVTERSARCTDQSTHKHDTTLREAGGRDRTWWAACTDQASLRVWAVVTSVTPPGRQARFDDHCAATGYPDSERSRNGSGGRDARA